MPLRWYEAMKKEIMMMSYLRQLADKGLELVQGANEEVTRGLTEMRDMISFFEREMPPLFTRWEEERNV